MYGDREPGRGPEPAYDPLRAVDPPLEGSPGCVEWCPICRTADVVRATTPPELLDQWHEIQREALLTMRSVLDHYLQRLDEEPRRSSRVEDIPIE